MAQPHCQRIVHDIYLCLGAKDFQRAYHMTYQSFCKLHQKVRHVGGRRDNQPEPPPITNGKIGSAVWLGCALRYFSGGSPCDIMVKYSLPHKEVMNSVWYIIEVINKNREWYTTYPTGHDEQLKIAADFKAKSSVGFGVCAGAVDGILSWIHPPTLEEAKKCFLWKKHKYRLNCQAGCDIRGRFLDLSITYGGVHCTIQLMEKGIPLKDLSLFVDLIDEVLSEDSNNIECYGAGFVEMVVNQEVVDVLDAYVETPDALLGGGELSMIFLAPPAKTGHLIINLCRHVLDYACLWRVHIWSAL
ncbi:LOW QUALITY PROTEIN: hypothetical protein HJC23_002240 [Cyclotella cryptica]|uniref:Uncharacterized protein n=1 Tax=Cyclotella cryptica TaxID=29204 RepID=A0ABD3QGA6_9STRA